VEIDTRAEMLRADSGKFPAGRRIAFEHAMQGFLHRRAAHPIVMLACMLACTPVRADVIVDAAAGFVHDSNLTRAAGADSIRGDGATLLSGSLGYLIAPSAGSVISLDVGALAERYARYRPLDHVEVALRAFWRHKFGVGAYVPYVAAGASVSRDDYRDDLRDGNRASGYVEVGRRFDASVDAALGAGVDRRRQRHGEPLVPGFSGDVFDLRGTNAWIRAACALGADVELGGRVGLRRGDVESTSHRGLAVFSASDAIAADRAFGDDDLFAYRLRGTTWAAAAALSWALSPHAAIDAGYAYELTHAAQGLDYRSRVVRLSISYRL
jgi:hypothetical protein